MIWVELGSAATLFRWHSPGQFELCLDAVETTGGNLPASVMRDNMHDWVLANEKMGKVLAAKGYHYQFVLRVTPGTLTAP